MILGTLRYYQIRRFASRSNILHNKAAITPPPTSLKNIAPQLQSPIDPTIEKPPLLQHLEAHKYHLEYREGELQEELTQDQLDAISSLTSSLYKPKDPFSEPSKADLIQERIASVEKKLERQRLIEEERYQEIVAQQHEMLKSTLSDFKRPLTAFFLLASGIYLSIHYGWHYLEGQEHILEMELRTGEYEKRLQELLDEQREFLSNGGKNGGEGGTSRGKRRWSLW